MARPVLRITRQSPKKAVLKRPVFQQLVDCIAVAKEKVGMHSDRSGTPAVTKWVVSISPPDSAEAYVIVSPVLDGREVLDSGTEKIPAPPWAKDRHIVSDSSELSDFDAPWPEHRLCYDLDRLTAAKCVGIHQKELHGVRGYLLCYYDGTERFLTVGNMKLMGYGTELP